MNDDQPWWTALYDDWLADQLLAREEGEVKETLDFLVAKLSLTAGDRVLDQCCGIGSLSIPLAARGLRVVGVDQAAGYIERAKTAAHARELDVDFVAADATRWAPKTRVKAAFNWWTSFGYSPSDTENAKMLSAAFDALEPGGRFALDTMNGVGLLRGFARDVVVRRRTPRGDVLLLRESTIDLARGMLKKDWTYFLGDRRVATHRSEVRLYMPDAIATMLAAAGFVDVELLGSTGGEALSLDSPRLIALARRPL
jgi:SAM-dependent methyltransferase